MLIINILWNNIVGRVIKKKSHYRTSTIVHAQYIGTIILYYMGLIVLKMYPVVLFL